MAAPLKLTHEDIKRIRRRVRKGEHQTDLARQFGVNRKTIRRRLDTLERVEKDKAERLAGKRLRWQAAREKRKLYERERDTVVGPPIEPGATGGGIFAAPNAGHTPEAGVESVLRLARPAEESLGPCRL